MTFLGGKGVILRSNTKNDLNDDYEGKVGTSPWCFNNIIYSVKNIYTSHVHLTVQPHSKQSKSSVNSVFIPCLGSPEESEADDDDDDEESFAQFHHKVSELLLQGLMRDRLLVLCFFNSLVIFSSSEFGSRGLLYSSSSSFSELSFIFSVSESCFFLAVAISAACLLRHLVLLFWNQTWDRKINASEHCPYPWSIRLLIFQQQKKAVDACEFN